MKKNILARSHILFIISIPNFDHTDTTLAIGRLSIMMGTKTMIRIAAINYCYMQHTLLLNINTNAAAVL